MASLSATARECLESEQDFDEDSCDDCAADAAEDTIPEFIHAARDTGVRRARCRAHARYQGSPENFVLPGPRDLGSVYGLDLARERSFRAAPLRTKVDLFRTRWIRPQSTSAVRRQRGRRHRSSGWSVGGRHRRRPGAGSSVDAHCEPRTFRLRLKFVPNIVEEAIHKMYGGATLIEKHDLIGLDLEDVVAAMRPRQHGARHQDSLVLGGESRTSANSATDDVATPRNGGRIRRRQGLGFGVGARHAGVSRRKSAVERSRQGASSIRRRAWARACSREASLAHANRR